MAGITTNGIGSGLDINNLVSQLVEAEVTPTRERLDREEATTLARISAFGLIKSAMGGLQSAVRGLADASGFVSGAVTSSDDEVLTATATGTTVRGNFSVDVQRLAEHHRLVMDQGVSSENATLGTGTLTISVGADSFDVAIDGSSNSLAGVRDAINNATGNPGVTASIIKVDDGAGGKVSKLVLSADETGESSRIAVAVDDADGNDLDVSGLSRLATQNLVDRSPANLDALVEIDGETVTSASNVLDDTISGITLTLAKADPGNPVTIASSEDSSAATEKVQALVDAFNGAIDVLREATNANPDGDSGVLVGDATARFMENRLRAGISNAVDGVNSVFGSLAAIGITTGDNGRLEFDSAEFESALSRDFEGVVGLFTSEQGVATRLDAQLDDYLDFNGVVDSRTDSLNGQIARITERRVALGARESSLEARYLAQFSAMDALVAQLQATGDFLTQQIDALNAGNRR